MLFKIGNITKIVIITFICKLKKSGIQWVIIKK